MRKTYLLLCFIFSCPMLYAQSDSWFVQVGVFEEQVNIDYFNNIGSNIFHSHDSYGFHRYYKGLYNDVEEARNAMKVFTDKGYYGVLVSKSELANSCSCHYIPMPQSTLNSLKNIFFDFDRSNLRAESRKQLNDLMTVMNDFPEYQVLLRAHTDSKGSNTYNDNLSMRRANAAKGYLTSRGIASTRIQTETFGEIKPIAKNELNGADTEEGRQFNRRVEIIIMDKDGHALNEIVDEIVVPQGLENN